jgi:hypothetical protein
VEREEAKSRGKMGEEGYRNRRGRSATEVSFRIIEQKGML